MPSPPQVPEKDRSPTQVSKPSPSEDPSSPVKGMYRLLDLISEQGSNGHGNRLFLGYQFHVVIKSVVDKIAIAQQSLQAFINAIAPGSSSSITKINFKRLDGCSLKPLGLYGSKEQIVRFLRKIRAVDSNTCVSLSDI